MNKTLYDKLHKTAKIKAGIYYSPPDFLRMLMYLELSRPMGDVSRWEKVFKRLILLNKNFPIKVKDCDPENIQRSFKIKDDQTLIRHEKHLSLISKANKTKSPYQENFSKLSKDKKSDLYISTIFNLSLIHI